MDGAPPDSRAVVRARDLEGFIAAETVLGTAALVPEVSLHLARESRAVFVAADELMDGGLGSRPYWAFAWPGGQGLARYILDHPALVAGKRVLDVGAGSGLGAIAAMRAGARQAVAADIDPLAIAAIVANARANEVPVAVTAHDLLGEAPEADVVLIGDLVYEPDLQLRVGAFIEEAQRSGIAVFYGDRTSARRPRLAFEQLAEYEAPLTPALVDDFVERARVWRLG
jgi:predicted nicotinamide N-methyase